MAQIQVAPIPKSKGLGAKRELYATVCFYYPQYTLQQAAKLPARDLNLLMKTARKIEAIKMYNLTQIAAAPHTKKGSGVSKLISHFKKEAN